MRAFYAAKYGDGWWRTASTTPTLWFMVEETQGPAAEAWIDAQWPSIAAFEYAHAPNGNPGGPAFWVVEYWWSGAGLVPQTIFAPGNEWLQRIRTWNG